MHHVQLGSHHQCHRLSQSHRPDSYRLLLLRWHGRKCLHHGGDYAESLGRDTVHHGTLPGQHETKRDYQTYRIQQELQQPGQWLCQVYGGQEWQERLSK